MPRQATRRKKVNLFFLSYTIYHGSNAVKHGDYLFEIKPNYSHREFYETIKRMKKTILSECLTSATDFHSLVINNLQSLGQVFEENDNTDKDD